MRWRVKTLFSPFNYELYSFMSSPGYDYFPFFIAKVRNKNFKNNFEWQAKFVINVAFVLFFIYQRKCLRNKNVCRSATRYWGCIPDRIINRNTLMALIFVRWKGAIITFESIQAVVREWTVLFRLIIPGHSHLSNYWLWRFRFKNHLSMRRFCFSFLPPSLINANFEKKMF